MNCRYCDRMKWQHSDYNFCPYCGKALRGGFIPNIVMKDKIWKLAGENAPVTREDLCIKYEGNNRTKN